MTQETGFAGFKSPHIKPLDHPPKNLLDSSHYMLENLLALIGRGSSFVLTTHDTADADGIAAQLVMACVLKVRGKQVRIVNSSDVPENFAFMDTDAVIETWDENRHLALLEKSVLLVLDTANEERTGEIGKFARQAAEVFYIDHHEPAGGSIKNGICDPAASSTSELAVEIALATGAKLDKTAACAAYTGIVFDTGFFAYSKTGERTFKAALELVKLGAQPAEAYRRLCENTPARALLLQKAAMSSLTMHCGNSVAVQVLRKEDFERTGGQSGDTDGFVNFPLKSREVAVSLFVKESPEGKVSGSLRSKEGFNVEKIARELGGGGHINAAGFKSKQDIDSTIESAIAKVKAAMEKSGIRKENQL